MMCKKYNGRFIHERALSSKKFFKSGFPKGSTTHIKDVSVFLKENSKGEKTEYAYVVTFQTGQVSHSSGIFVTIFLSPDVFMEF